MPHWIWTVQPRSVFPVTLRVHAIVEFQLIIAFQPNVVFPVIRVVPVTSRLYHGFVFQIPIFEPLS